MRDRVLSATAACQGLRSVVGPPIGELLKDPKTSVAVLKEIKQYAKARGIQAASEREKDVFLAIYFAAIAGALAYHGEHITEHADTDLARFFGHYVSAEWMPSSLRELFGRAVRGVQRGKETRHTMTAVVEATSLPRTVRRPPPC